VSHGRCCAVPCRAACVSCAVFSAHMREKALEALLWFTQLPAPRDRPPLLTPSEMVQWMSTGAWGVQVLHVMQLVLRSFPSLAVSVFCRCCGSGSVLKLLTLPLYRLMCKHCSRTQCSYQPTLG
jgi:hypothetical protein